MHETVDDFLAEYKHEPQTVFEFIRCLDISSSPKQEASPSNPEDFPDFLVCELTHENCEHKFTSIKSSQMHGAKQKSTRTYPGKRKITVPPGDKGRMKPSKIHLSIEQREERRRNQNKEAQQRSRNKKLLAMAKNSSLKRTQQQSFHRGNNRIIPNCKAQKLPKFGQSAAELTASPNIH